MPLSLQSGHIHGLAWCAFLSRLHRRPLFVGQVMDPRPLATTAKGHTAGEFGTPSAACSDRKSHQLYHYVICCSFCHLSMSDMQAMTS